MTLRDNDYLSFPLTAEQHFELVHRASTRQPEASLWVAVIMEAMDCLSGNVGGVLNRTTKIREIEHARNWFLGEESGPGTFQWICNVLDLPAGRILKKLRQAGQLSGPIGFRTQDHDEKTHDANATRVNLHDLHGREKLFE